MKRHEAAAAVSAIVDGRLKTDGDAVPPALYPRGWLARVELLAELGPDEKEEGRARCSNRSS